MRDRLTRQKRHNRKSGRRCVWTTGKALLWGLQSTVTATAFQLHRTEETRLDRPRDRHREGQKCRTEGRKHKGCRQERDNHREEAASHQEADPTFRVNRKELPGKEAPAQRCTVCPRDWACE